MNGRIKIILFLSCLLASAKGLGCPTCVGRFEKDKPVFFSDEFYRSTTEKIDTDQGIQKGSPHADQGIQKENPSDDNAE